MHLRAHARDETSIVVGPLRIQLATQRVTLGGVVLRLTRIEQNLLTALAYHAGRVLTREHLLVVAWGVDSAEHAQSLRAYIARLRKKLEPDPARPRWLVTKQRVGYCLRREPAD